jgi:hypothetical protein
MPICSTRTARSRSTGILGDRWVWVILRQAFNGARRFEDFQRGIGLARNGLTEHLNWLVDNGIFERRDYKTAMPAAPSRSSAAASSCSASIADEPDRRPHRQVGRQSTEHILVVNTVGTQLHSAYSNLGVQSFVPSVSAPRERGGLTTEMRRQVFA